MRLTLNSIVNNTLPYVCTVPLCECHTEPDRSLRIYILKRLRHRESTTPLFPPPTAAPPPPFRLWIACIPSSCSFLTETLNLDSSLSFLCKPTDLTTPPSTQPSHQCNSTTMNFRTVFAVFIGLAATAIAAPVAEPDSTVASEGGFGGPHSGRE